MKMNTVNTTHHIHGINKWNYEKVPAKNLRIKKMQLSSSFLVYSYFIK